MAQNTDDVIFKKGDRVNFIGNSITHGGEFHNFILLYYATRFPEAKITFYNSGIWGDNANSFLQRMDNDILKNPAEWSVVMAGMNDVNRGLYAASRQNEPDIEAKKQRALDDYRGYLEKVIQRLLQANTKIILQKPTIYDQTGTLPAENLFGVNDALQKCTFIIDELALKYNLKVVDYWTILNNLNKQVQVNNPAATLISNDRVHPGSPGNFIMAYQFLKDTGAPKYVADIDIAKGELKRCKDCVITAFKASENKIEFTYKAKSLPFPVAAEAESALSLVPFSQELNSELLKIAKLQAGDYALTIDGNFIRNYTSAELNKGVNLALEKRTPQYKQAQKVMAQCIQYRAYQRKLRDIRRVEINYLPKELSNATFSDIKNYIDNLRNTNDAKYTANKALFDAYLIDKPKETETEQQLAVALEKIYSINKPVEHTFLISRGAGTDTNPQETHSWGFDEPVISNRVEGWTIVNYNNANTEDGILNLIGNQSYNHIRYDVPSTNAVDPAQSKTAVIRLKNQTANTNARFYWWGSAATAAYIDFTITPNDTEFKEYKIDLTKDIRWSGTINIIRFDVPSPLHAISFGKTVDIDYVKLTTEVLPEPEPEPVQPMAPRIPAPFGVNLAGADFGENMPGVHNTDYTYPTAAELDYFKSKGLNLIRFPFKWERIQRTLNGPLDEVELGRMKNFVEAAHKKGMWILLDMHNYGRRKIDTTTYLIGSPTIPVSAVTDAWQKLALAFKDYENIWGYGIMNEPHDMLTSTPWFNIAQAIIDTIRNVDTETTIVVGGDSWSSATRWPTASNNLKDLVDSSDKLIFEAHLYFDDDASGKYDQTYEGEQANPNIGVTRATPFVKWLRDNNLNGFMGEYGVPDNDPRWLTALDNMLVFLKNNKINGTYWAAGPWWNTYTLAVEPIGGVDRPQMAVLEKYTTANTEYSGELEVDPQTHIWEFNGTVESNRIDDWTIVNYSNASSSSGILTLPVGQSYNHIKYDVPASNAITPTTTKYAVIRLKNETAETKARFYWWGPVGDNVANYVEFDITPNDSDFKEYIVDLSQNPAWTSKSSIRIIRFDVPALASTASIGKLVQIDQVRLLASLQHNYTWNFNEPVANNKAEGWNIVNYTGAYTAAGILNLTAAQAYNNIRLDVPASTPIDPTVYKFVTIRLRNETAETKARFYWWGPVGDNVANFVEFDISANDSDFKEYSVNLGQQPLWIGKSSIRIIRFDVPSPVGVASLGKAVAIDYISLSPYMAQQAGTAFVTSAAFKGKELRIAELYIITAADKTIKVAAFAPEAGKATLVITDMLGRKLLDQQLSLSKGENILEGKVKTLPAGVYIGTLYLEKEKVARKFAVE
ncbi:cellulase family glycosylhydrolase [Pontibacter sp. SGAir0037]|uniref:cellulase family glycosylhydrolase n=1 Tax=Pontibacter sp. SGAir0037 TaxID=2571030 RepID=UPI00143D8A2B|nr:cellulase family glycosylhydrolase [Pontibacter sp. SGAir0037]